MKVDTNNTIETYSQFLESVQLLRTDFLERNLNNIELSTKALFDELEKLQKISPLAFYLSLNVRDARLSKLGQLIVKTSIISKYLSESQGFSRETQAAILLAINYYIFALAPSLVKPSADDLPNALFRALKNGSNTALKALINNGLEKKQSNLVFKQAYELLRGIASKTKYAYKFNVAQNIFKLTIESAFYCVTFTKHKPLNIESALMLSASNSRIFKGLTIPRNLTKMWISPKVVRRHNNELALLIGPCLKEPDTWSICHLESDLRPTEPFLISSVDSSKLRFEHIQLKVDSIWLEQICEDIFVHIDQSRWETPKAKKYSLLEPPQYLWELSKLISSGSNQKIIEALYDFPMQKKLILGYAKQVNRQQIPVTDLGHAIAMLGAMRVFPIICLNEMNLLEKTSMTIHSFSQINKTKLYASLASAISFQTKIDLPEYCELMARIVMTNRFQDSSIKAWHKRAKTTALNWQLPKPYISAIYNFFRSQTQSLSLNEVSKANKPLLAILLLTERMFLQITEPANVDLNSHPNVDVLKTLNISLHEYQNFFDLIVDKVNPTTTFE